MAKLFKNNIISDKLQNFIIPDLEDKINILKSWENLYKTQKFHNKKEEELEWPFWDDFFWKILWYASLSENEIYNRKFQPKVLQWWQKADLWLGFFASDNEIMKVVIELKDSKTSLDKPQQRAGNLTPVQQAFKYKPYFKECDFVIVSNFYETRLYIDSYYDFEVWTLTDLVDDKDNYYNFRVFYYLLCKDNLIREQWDSNTKSLLSIIRTQEKEITKKFYSEYSNLRKELFKDIIKHNSFKKSEVNLALNKTQTIIDRIIFIHFCEDLGLLPSWKLNENILKAGEIGFTPWDVLKVFFRWVDRWSEKLWIPNWYNWGLFREDKELDKLVIWDDICKKFVDLWEYDFANDLSVNILGHIFEQSISDIEEIKSKINLNEEEKTVSKRKKDGIFYTPEYIVDYIVKNSVGKKIDEREEELKEKHNLKEEITDKNYEKRAIIVYSELQEKVQNIKVLDPACWSGAFLVKVFDFLLEKNKEIAKKLEDLTWSISMQKEDDFKNILQNNIYWVDLNEESVEITKLSLWLRTASKWKKLANLDSNIKCWNSLIDDESVAGDKAFKWEKEFPFCHSELDSESRGFDVIVGNPPYIKEFVNKNAFEWLKNNKYYQWKMDLWQFFACKWLDWLKDDWYISYIAPNNWITNAWASIMREKVLDVWKIIDFVDFWDFKIFEDAWIQTMIFVIKKQKDNLKYKTNYSKIINKNTTDLEIWNFLNSKIIGNWFINYKSQIDKNSLIWKNISFQNDTNAIILDKMDKNRNFILEDKEVAQWIVWAPDEAYLLTNDDLFFNEEKKFIKKFYTNSWKYASWNQDKYIIYLTNANFEWKRIEDYKNIFNHFEPNKQNLIEARIKLKTPNKPYYFLHRERDEKFFKIWAKMIAWTRVSKPAFYYTEDEYYCSRALNVIKTDRINLKYLSAILNSSISNFWLKYNWKLTWDLLQVDKGPLLSIPIKNIPLSQQQPFIEKADFMLSKNKELQEKLNSSLEFLKNRFALEKINQKLEKFYELDFIEFKKALNIKKISMSDEEDLMNWFKTKKQDLMSIKTQIDECDKEIDNMVFDLYGLDEEERKVVLGS